MSGNPWPYLVRKYLMVQGSRTLETLEGETFEEFLNRHYSAGWKVHSTLFDPNNMGVIVVFIAANAPA